MTFPSPDRHVAHAREILAYWIERSRTRRSLRGVDDRVLEDVGLSREQAESEAAKFFWQT